MTFVYVLSNVQETVKRNVKRHIFLYILFCETLTFSLYSTRTSVMRTTDTFLAQSSDSHRTSTSLVLTLYSSAVTNLSFLKVKKRIAMFKALQYLSIGCIVDVRVLSRIYRLGEKSWVSEGHKVSKGSGGMPPPPETFSNEYVLRCNVMHFATELFEKCYSVCTDLVESGWFFRFSSLYTVMMELGIFWGESFYPSNTLDRTLDINFRPFWNQLYRERFMINLSNVYMYK